MQEEFENLPEEEKASLNEKNDFNHTGDDEQMNDEHEEKRNTFYSMAPSMDPSMFHSMESERRENTREITRMKFQEDIARNKVIEAKERQRKRDYQLEQELIRKQGAFDRTGLSKDYLENWKKDNPEFMEKKQAEWDAEDRAREDSNGYDRRTLWD